MHLSKTEAVKNMKIKQRIISQMVELRLPNSALKAWPLRHQNPHVLPIQSNIHIISDSKGLSETTIKFWSASEFIER